MGADMYFEWRDGGCTEEVNRLTAENKELREKLKEAVHQGMAGATRGYEELLERHRNCVLGLLWCCKSYMEHPTDPKQVNSLDLITQATLKDIREMLGIGVEDV